MAMESRTEAEQLSYMEGQIVALQLILTDIMKEIDPRGNLMKRVRDRVDERLDTLSRTSTPSQQSTDPEPFVDGTLDGVRRFVELLDLTP